MDKQQIEEFEKLKSKFPTDLGKLNDEELKILLSGFTEDMRGNSGTTEIVLRTNALVALVQGELTDRRVRRVEKFSKGINIASLAIAGLSLLVSLVALIK